MNLKKYLKTWEGTQTENKWGRIFQGGLIAIVFLLVVQVFSKETIVTIQPFTLTEEAWVTKNNASQSYKEAWGFAFAQL
ncbi:TPA: pilus assembly protein, partial [Klebsiella pneumoniae subsp. pneumoniae]|nr:pilus assembly protein [Klebsiella pneumoniae subsp. pneumoniae]